MKEKNIIRTRRYESPCGILLLGSFDGKLCLCDWQVEKHRDHVDRRLKRILHADFEEGTSDVIEKAVLQLDGYFVGKRRVFDMPLLFVGTDFQKKVWNKLREIPYGNTISYREEALMLNRPKSFKAIAYANGKNPVLILIPCHRVINSDGSLGRYSMGDKRKEAILRFENPELGEKIMKITRENEELFGPQYKLPSI